MPSLILRPGSPAATTHRWHDAPCTIGRSSANNIQLDENAVSSAHALIERRGDQFWIIDLNSTNGTFLNGKKITEAVLCNGDEILLGEVVPLRFEIPPEITSTPEATIVAPAPSSASQEVALMPVGTGGGQLMPRGGQCPGCGTLVPFSVNFCPRCGAPMGQATALAFPMQPQPVGFVRPMEHPGAQSAGMLPLLALLCGVFGFLVLPAPIAIILGLLALGSIRQHGGLESDRKQATWGVVLGIIWVVLSLGAITWYGWDQFHKGREQNLAQQHELLDKNIREVETTIVTDLKGIARAEKLAKVVHVKDPDQTGVGQYLNLDELAKVDTSLFNRDLATGHTHGYRFIIRDPTEGNYLAVAEPEQYGVTGKRTFTIDPSGIVRAQDLNGKSQAQYAGSLAVANEFKTAFDEGMDDAIAKEAIAWAKRLANEGKFAACRQILDIIPEQFAMTSAAQELLATKKSVDPFIVEAQAQARHQKAKTAADTGDLKHAIGLLKEITELFPSYTRITAVTDDLNNYTTALAQKLDKEAKALFEKAQAAERDNKSDEALDLYVQIEKNYPETEWAKRIGEVRPGLQLSVREKGAEQLFAQARSLSLPDNYRDIFSIVEQLIRNYADTDYVKQNADPIVALRQKALAQQYRAQAIEQMNAGRDTDALARLEEAVAQNTDLRPAFKDLFLKLYLRVGHKRMDEGDQRLALQLYRKYLTLEPEKSEVNPAVLCELAYAVAKSDFQQGHYPEAAQNFIAARAGFEKDPEYNDLFGAVLFALGKYEESLTYFDRAIATKPTVGNYYARRGYAQLIRALYIEQDAMTAFAGLLGQDTAASLPSAPNTPVPANTNTPPADASSAMNTNSFAPTFTTELPKTVLGARPEVQVKYDATTSQALLDEVLDLIDQIQDAGTGSDVDHTAKRVAHINSSKLKSRQSNPNSDTSTNSTTTTTRPDTPSNAKLRLNRIRTGVELGNALSSVHQKVLDNNTRKTKAADALRRMATLFHNGNSDLAQAIQLGADQSPALSEILKTTQQHEFKVAEAGSAIAAYLGVEIELLQNAYDIAETSYRNLRAQHVTANDPTMTLDIYFSKLFDRRSFDKGVQNLREAGAVKAPLAGYILVAPPTTNTTPSAATLLLQRLTATPIPPASTATPVKSAPTVP